MKISEAISLLRLRLGQAGWDDDNTMTDEALFKMISDAAAIVFNRYRERFYAISDWHWNTYGIKLEMVGEDMFPCETIDRCHVLQSVHSIPEPLMSRNSPMFKVFNGKSQLVQNDTSLKYDNLLSNMLSWEVVNGKLRIFGTKTLKAVTIKTISANITDWLDKKYCPETNTVECYDLDEMDFPLLNDAKFSGMTYDIVLQQLQLPVQEPNQNPAH